MPLSSVSVLAARRVLGAILVALSAAACDGEGGTDPLLPPTDDMRLASLTVTDTAWKTITRHDFIYDGAGRLSRVEFRISEVPNGPPVRLTRYFEHEYEGERLARTNVFGLAADSLHYVNYAAFTYMYDARGHLESQKFEISNPTGVSEYMTDFDHDARGRLSERRERAGDRYTFHYGAGDVLERTEYHPDEIVIHQTYQHDARRNPFYLRTAHVNSLIMPLITWPMLLSPNNMLRQENRVGSDPTLISSVRNRYEYDDDGRPLHLAQHFINDHMPGARGTWIFIDFDYEPAN